MTAGAPLFRVVHGNPSVEETAALAAVFAAKLAAGDQPARPGAAGRWADRARSVRAPLTRGPDAWRASGQPR